MMLSSPVRAGGFCRGLALALGATAAISGSGILDFVEQALIEARFRLMSQPIGDRVVLIEIDRSSLDQIGVWPWPRRLHALALDRLGAAGAAQVVFDIDFSARTSEADDTALERALQRADPHALLAAFSDVGPDGEAVDVGPIAPLLAQATPVAVDMEAASDGRVWRAEPARAWRGERILTLFAAMADGAARPEGGFWIDYAIDPRGAPTLSFADVAAGRFEAEDVRGRIALIGATAIELGDSVPVPRWGLLPGPVVQMIAAETLQRGRALRRAPAPMALAFAAPFAAAGLALARRRRPAAAAAGLVGLAVAATALATLIQREAAVILDLAPALLALTLAAPIGYADRARWLDLKLLRERLARARSDALMARVADNMMDGLATLDAEGRLLTLNRAAARMFGLREPDVAVEGMSRFLPGLPQNRPEAVVAALEALRAAGRGRRLICARSDGARFYAEAAVTALDAPENDRMWIVAIRDVTEMVAAERATRRRERLLTELRIRAESATRTRTEFVAAMSHELRTPLNGVIGLSAMIADEVFGPTGSDRYKLFAGEIRDSGQRLLRLLTHILDVANADMDRLEINLAASDMGALIGDTVELQRARAMGKGLALRVETPDDPLIAQIDAVAVAKAVGNVLANAIRFTELGEVAVRLFEADGWARVEISDTGPGMTPETRARCFEPFAQRADGVRTHEGGGLGLTVARALILRHGGVIDIKSALGAGTCVRIGLPGVTRSLAAGATPETATGAVA
jgi:PAS domain S-box-containing protein